MRCFCRPVDRLQCHACSAAVSSATSVSMSRTHLRCPHGQLSDDPRARANFEHLWTLRIRTSRLKSISSCHKGAHGCGKKGSLPILQESCGPRTPGLNAAVRQLCRTSTVTSWRLSRRSTLFCAVHAHARNWYCACSNTQHCGEMLRCDVVLCARDRI